VITLLFVFLKVKHSRTHQIFALKAILKETVIEGDDVDIILREKNILALADKELCLCNINKQNKLIRSV
jgi:hypothetical protein